MYYIFIEDIAGKRHGILSDGSIADGVPEACLCDTECKAITRKVDFYFRYRTTSGIRTLFGMCEPVTAGIYFSVE